MGGPYAPVDAVGENPLVLNGSTHPGVTARSGLFEDRNDGIVFGQGCARSWWTSRAIASAAVICSSCRTFVYVSAVSTMLECPSIACTVLRWVPAARARPAVRRGAGHAAAPAEPGQARQGAGTGESGSPRGPPAVVNTGAPAFWPPARVAVGGGSAGTRPWWCPAMVAAGRRLGRTDGDFQAAASETVAVRC